MPKVPSFFEQVAEKVPNIRAIPPWLAWDPVDSTDDGRLQTPAAPGDPSAPWIAVNFDPLTADFVIPIHVPLGAGGEDPVSDPDLSDLIDQQLVRQFLASAPSADMLAAYLPWHFYGPSFGIYVFARNALAFIGALASRLGVTPNHSEGTV